MYTYYHARMFHGSNILSGILFYLSCCYFITETISKDKIIIHFFCKFAVFIVCDLSVVSSSSVLFPFNLSKRNAILKILRCTEVLSASFLSSGFTIMAVINSPERKMAKWHLCALYKTTKKFHIYLGQESKEKKMP